MYSTLSVHTSSSIQLAVCLTTADYCKSFMIYLRTIFFSPIPLPTLLLLLAPTCLLSHPSSTLLLSHLSTLLPSFSPLPSLHYPLVPPLLSPPYPTTFLFFSHPSMLLLFPMAQVEHAGTFCVLSSVLKQLKVEGIVNLFFCSNQAWSTCTMVRQNILNVIKCRVEQGHG